MREKGREGGGRELFCIVFTNHKSVLGSGYVLSTVGDRTKYEIYSNVVRKGKKKPNNNLST